MCLSYLLLFLLVLCFSIFLSIYTLVNKTNSNHFAGDIFKKQLCYGLPEYGYGFTKQNCLEAIECGNNINCVYQGQPANRGYTTPGGVKAGSFGNPEILGYPYYL